MLLKSPLLVFATVLVMPAILLGAVAAAGTVLLEEETVVVMAETAPAITSQPANQTIVLGQTATLSVTASGTEPLAYQWQVSTDLVFGWTDLTDGGPYSGVKQATLMVTPANASQVIQYYRCLVTNSAGSASSTGVFVWAHSAPMIGVGALSPPGQVDVIVNAGQDATFVAVQSFGAILGWPGLATFQWQFSNDRGASWNNLPAGAPYNITGSLSNHSAAQFLTITNVPVSFDGLQYRVVATNIAGSTTSNVSTLTVLPAAPKRFVTDADGDGKSEIGVFRPSIGGWFIRKSSEGYSTATAPFYQWGLPGDVPVAADFDGDGKIELSVFRPPTGQWFTRYSSQDYNAGSPGVYQWGLPGDVPIAGDFDGDGRSELAVFRPSIGGWFIRKSTEGYSSATASFYQWGLPGDRPIAGDFDGDGKTELAVFRPATGQWFIRYSSQNYDASTPDVYQWGLPVDVPLAGDFDGDGRNDLAVFRPPTGQWFIRYSAQNYDISTAGLYQWGLPGDVPLGIDFDADFKSEIAVFRPSTGQWFIRYSAQDFSVGTAGLYQWGLPGDVPIKP